MRQISIKKGSQLEGDFYSPDQIVGLRRFIKAAKYSGYEYHEVLEAWDESYNLKCERKRIHIRLRRAIYSSSGRAAYTCVSKITLAQRFKLATSAMDPHDIKLCYPAFLQTTMEVYGLTMDTSEKRGQDENIA